MKITAIETYTVGVEWKNWLFLRVLTDEGLHGIGEATMNGFIKTTEAAIHELKHFAIGKDPRQIVALTAALLETIQDGGHIHRLAAAGIEVACWDILGKSLGVPDPPTARRQDPRQRAGLRERLVPRRAHARRRFVALAETVAAHGFRALKFDPFGAARGTIDEPNLQIAYDILAALRERFGPEFKILIDVHCRFMPGESLRVAGRLAPLDLYWWEEPTTAEREELTNEIASQCPIPVATGEQFDRIGQVHDPGPGRPRQHLPAGADVARRHRQHPGGGGHRPRQRCLDRAASERRPGRHGGLPAIGSMRAELPDPGALRSVQRSLDAATW